METTLSPREAVGICASLMNEHIHKKKDEEKEDMKGNNKVAVELVKDDKTNECQLGADRQA
ncbi:MAG: hypothetical protein A2Y04_01180 [Omnitrophica WOR_2 bacterium GWC2_45_7]|nr:MAG: hypothetical protein A2Y04_01180 [Omnitrophica WOR_2 bacterium GWC2_45_7]